MGMNRRMTFVTIMGMNRRMTFVTIMGMKSTRLHDDVFLIGIRDLESLSRLTQLPTVRQVLQRYHQHLNETKICAKCQSFDD
jgi:hypothetical protein